MTLFQIAADTARAAADSLAAAADTLGAGAIERMPEAPPTPLETVMLQQDKLFVVAAVVLLIWIGVALFLLATDRRLDRLERALDARDRADAHR